MRSAYGEERLIDLMQSWPYRGLETISFSSQGWIGGKHFLPFYKFPDHFYMYTAIKGNSRYAGTASITSMTTSEDSFKRLF